MTSESPGRARTLIVVRPGSAAHPFEPSLRATLALLPDSPTVVAPTTLLPRLVALGGSARLVDAASFSISAWHRAVVEGRDDVLLLDARVSLLERTLPALTRAIAHDRVGAASAYSSAGVILTALDALLDDAGRPTEDAVRLAAALTTAGVDRDHPIGVAEPTCTLFKAAALARIDSLPEEPAATLSSRYSLVLGELGFWRVAAAKALAPAVPGVHVSPEECDPEDPLARARLAALRRVDTRRTFFDMNGFAASTGGAKVRRSRIAIDLAGAPYHGSAMNGTRRVCYAAARAVEERFADSADVAIVVDELEEVARIGLRRSTPIVGWDGVPAGQFDVVFRPTQYPSHGSLLAAVRGSRALSVVLLDLIAYQVEGLREQLVDTARGPVCRLDDLLDYRFVTDLTFALARSVFVISHSVDEEVRLLYGGRPELVAKLRLLPLCDLREPREPPVPMASLVGRPFFLWVGNRYPFKNLAQVLRAYDQLVAKQPSAPALVLVGAEARSPDLSAVARARIAVLDAPTDRELDWLYRNACAYISSSLYEGFGLPLLEAVLARAPLLVSRTPTNRELLGGDVTGSFTSTAELTELLARVQRDPDRFRDARLAASHDRESFARSIASGIEEALRDPGERPFLPHDAATLLAEPRRYRANVGEDRWTAPIGRALERFPRLWRLGKSVLDTFLPS